MNRDNTQGVNTTPNSKTIIYENSFQKGSLFGRIGNIRILSGRRKGVDEKPSGGYN